MQRSRTHQRGLTLIELMVGTAIALFLTAAAVAFVRHETRLMGVSMDKLNMSQTGRAAVTLLADDLRQAGAGVGYQNDGTFGGLLLGNFNAGGVAFNTNGGAAAAADTAGPQNYPLPVGVGTDLSLQHSPRGELRGPTYLFATRDVGIRYANGSVATIADWQSTGAGQLCDARGQDFQVGEVAMMWDETFITGQSVTIGGLAGGACSYTNCVDGCRTLTFAPDATYQTGAAANVSFLRGELHGRLRTAVWFVVSENNVGTLRRVEFDGTNNCAARDNTCGGAVADFVETLQVQVWSWDNVTNEWLSAGQQAIQTRSRLRVDIEAIIRSRAPDTRQHPRQALRLRAGTCLPATGACNQLGDYYDRRAFRTSVELKNSARLRLQ